MHTSYEEDFYDNLTIEPRFELIFQRDTGVWPGADSIFTARSLHRLRSLLFGKQSENALLLQVGGGKFLYATQLFIYYLRGNVYRD